VIFEKPIDCWHGMSTPFPALVKMELFGWSVWPCAVKVYPVSYSILRVSSQIWWTLVNCHGGKKGSCQLDEKFIWCDGKSLGPGTYVAL